MAKAKKKMKQFIKEIESTRVKKDGSKVNNVFNKSKFNEFVNILANDTDFCVEIIDKVSGDEITTTKFNPSEIIRKWCQKILEKGGVDKSESSVALSPDFEIPSADLYEFIAAALYTYIKTGNTFDMLKTPTFTASLQIRDVEKSSNTREAFHPQTRESLGTFTTTTEAHEELVVKHSTPKWLKKRAKKK